MDWSELAEPLIKATVSFIEAATPRRAGQPSHSQAKLSASINIVQTALASAAAAGAVTMDEAHDIAAIASKVQTTVIDMKNQGQLGGLTSTTPPLVLVSAPPPVIVPNLPDAEMMAAAKAKADGLSKFISPGFKVQPGLASVGEKFKLPNVLGINK